MSKDCSDDLARLRIAYDASPSVRARACRWAYRVIRKSGNGAALRRDLACSPADRRWRVLRRWLPDEAIGKLADLIKSG